MPKLLAIAEALLLEKIVSGGGWPLSRKSRAGLVLMVLAALFVLVAVGFAIVGFHLWVQGQYPPDIAALVTAGAVLGLALLSALGAFAILRRRRLRLESFKHDIKSNIQAVIATVDEELGTQIRDNPRVAVALASLAGFVLAEKLH